MWDINSTLLVSDDSVANDGKSRKKNASHICLVSVAVQLEYELGWQHKTTYTQQKQLFINDKTDFIYKYMPFDDDDWL